MKLTILTKSLLITAIILFITLCAVYKIEKERPADLIPTPTFSSTPLTMPSSTPAITPKIDTSNWKTYTSRNGENGYTIKYPENLKIEQPVPDIFIIYAPNNKEYLQIQNSDTNSTPPSPKNYIPNLAQFVGKVNIGGKVSDKYFTRNPQGEGGIIKNTPYTDYVVVLGEKQWIQIDYFGEKDVAALFENILSTLNFTE